MLCHRAHFAPVRASFVRCPRTGKVPCAEVNFGGYPVSQDFQASCDGCSIRFRSNRMKRCILPSCLAFVVSFSSVVGAQQPPAVKQTAESKTSDPKWTEDDRRKLLVKAQRGDAGSQMWLATAYEQGWFGETNISEALKWYKKSAAKGNPDAQNELGRMYEDGEGQNQDYTQAAKWYRKAAEHVPDLGGAGQGRNNLGLLYLEGRGVPKDYIQAYMWFRLSRGDTINLHYAKEHMTQEEILKAEHLTQEWKIRHRDQQD